MSDQTDGEAALGDQLAQAPLDLNSDATMRQRPDDRGRRP